MFESTPVALAVMVFAESAEAEGAVQTLKDQSEALFA